LFAGVLLQVVSHVVRSRGWFNILRATFPRERELRARDVVAASFAGAGVNGVVPARGGDVVKLAFIHRRTRGASYTSLIATALPETAFESLVAAALLAWMFVHGLMPIPSLGGELPIHGAGVGLPDPMATGLFTIAALATSAGLGRWLWRRSRLANQLRQGLAILQSPRRFIGQVASWQALARLIRLGSLVAFLAAFGLPPTLEAAVLVMAVQGGGRVIPLGTVSAGLRVAMLTHGLSQVSGEPADPAATAVFVLGSGATISAVMLATAAVLIGRELGTCSPRKALRCARARFQPPPVGRPAVC
jgi:hypothetical protein